MLKTNKGFTIIEVLIMIAVIGILTTIGLVSFSSIQANVRDKQRSSQATIISEALEKYYDENGEYPSCNDMAQAPAAVTSTTLKGLDKTILTTPQSTSGTNSILSLCTDLASLAGNTDKFSYVGDNFCVSDPQLTCEQFSLKYISETTGAIKEINSRHSSYIAAAVPLDAPQSSPSVSVTLNGGNILATITPITCAVGTAEYGIDSRINDGSWDGYTGWSSTNLTATRAATDNYKYGYRAQARCYVDSTHYSASTIGAESTYNNTVTPPDPGVTADPQSSPSMFVTLNGTNILATINQITCSAGTVQYGIDSRINDGSWTGFTPWSTLLTSTQSATAGYKYGYRAQARCYVDSTHYSNAIIGAESTYTYTVYTGGNGTGTGTGTGNSGTTVAAPATPYMTIALNGNRISITATVTPVTCSTGTPQYSIDRRTDSHSWDGYTSWSTSTTASRDTANGVKYEYRAQARCYVDYANYSTTTIGPRATYTYVIAPPNIANAIVIDGTYDWINALEAVMATPSSCTEGTPAYAIFRRLTTETQAQGIKVGGYNFGHTPALSVPGIAITIPPHPSTGNYKYWMQAMCFIDVNHFSTTVSSAETTYMRRIEAPAKVNPYVASSTASTVTYSWSAAICAGGTTVKYEYHLTRLNGPNGTDTTNTSTVFPSSGAYPETTNTSITLNNADQGYWTTFVLNSYCYNDINRSANQSEYLGWYREITPPAAPTFSLSIVNSRWVYMPVSSSCGSGMTLLSRYDVYMSYYGGVNYYWSATGAGGWYGANGTWAINDMANHGTTFGWTVGLGSGANYPSGMPWYTRVELKCRNYTTNNDSVSSGVIQSPVLYTP